MFQKPAPVGFSSGESRFKMKERLTPGSLVKDKVGPGAYNVVRRNRSVRKYGNVSQKMQKKIQVQKVPSIPSHQYVFGYEETVGNCNYEINIRW